MNERICKFIVCASRDSAFESTHTLLGKTSHKIRLTLPLLASDLKVMKSSESKSAANIVPDTVWRAKGNSTRTRLATAGVFYSRSEVSKNQSLSRKIIMCLLVWQAFRYVKFFASQNKTIVMSERRLSREDVLRTILTSVNKSIFSKQVLKIYVNK